MKIDNNFIYFSHNPKHLRAHYIRSSKVWRIPNTMGAIQEYLSIFSSPTLEDYLKKKREKYQNHIAIKLLEDVEGNPLLRPYQRVDVAFLNKLPHAGIFSEQRTGE